MGKECFKKKNIYRGCRQDNGEEIQGFLIKEYGDYYIAVEDAESLVYPVAEATIYPAYAKKDQLASLLGTAWYKSKEQIPYLQDVVLISKGYYDTETYHSTFDALRAYQAKVVGIQEDRLTYDDILCFLIFPACELFLSKKDFLHIIYEKMFQQGIIFHKMWEKEYKELTSEYLLYCLLSELCNLPKNKFMMNEKELKEAEHVI